VELSPLTDAPGGWHGLVRREPEGTVVHAGTFFESAGCFVEAAVVWPEQRDADVERAVLEGIAPCDADAPDRLWQALGLSVRIDAGYDLLRHSSRVGRVIWDFAADPKRGPHLTVRRLAMPQHWLRAPLGDWLPSQIPGDYKETERLDRTVNEHPGAEVVSIGRARPADRLRRRRRLRLDLAWLCDVESRVYHVTCTEASRRRRPDLPQPFAVQCCRAVRVPVAGQGHAC
jgi:hypothetical protein